MPGFTGNSPFIIFNQFRKGATSEPIRTDSLPNEKLNIGYLEDLLDRSERDNSGVHKIKVYVTVEADADKQATPNPSTNSGRFFAYFPQESKYLLKPMNYISHSSHLRILSDCLQIMRSIILFCISMHEVKNKNGSNSESEELEEYSYKRIQCLID